MKTLIKCTKDGQLHYINHNCSHNIEPLVKKREFNVMGYVLTHNLECGFCPFRTHQFYYKEVSHGKDSERLPARKGSAD